MNERRGGRAAGAGGRRPRCSRSARVGVGAGPPRRGTRRCRAGAGRTAPASPPKWGRGAGKRGVCGKENGKNTSLTLRSSLLALSPAPPPFASRSGGSSAALEGAPGPDRGSGCGRTGSPSAPARVAEPRRARRQWQRRLRAGRASDPDVQGTGEEGEGGMPGSEGAMDLSGRAHALGARPAR